MITSSLLHIFRNVPYGRETLMQSAYFCRLMDVSLHIYFPVHDQFLMYFQNRIVTVPLDSTYLRDPETARDHAREIVEKEGISFHPVEPKGYTASTLPEVPVHFQFMTCPRVLSDLHARIGLGHVGPRVRQIVKSAPFPVLLPAHLAREWKSVTSFFGGSDHSVKALHLAAQISKKTGFPLNLFTWSEGRPRRHFEKILEEKGGMKELEGVEWRWIFREDQDVKVSLYEVPYDSILVAGSFGSSDVRKVLFGSFTEIIHSVLPNPIVLVGPLYHRI